MEPTYFQLDEFYLDLQEDGKEIVPLTQDAIEACPYPGLRPFRTSEFHLFWGRDGQAGELLRRLGETRFLAVIGSSGAGKSSLIRAGLIPQLYGGYLKEAGERWNIAICRPGRDPIENLAIALSSVKCGSRDNQKILEERGGISETLRRTVYGILEVNQQLQATPGQTAANGQQKNLLIIIDQFEELFRFRQEATEYTPLKSHFVNLLIKASLQPESKVYVIITMRSEFLGECVKYRGLPEIINDGQYLVPQLNRSQIKEVIEGPLTSTSRTMDPRLVSILLNEIEETRLRDNLDQLPILQHALMRTYKNGTAPVIVPEDYSAVGGMESALGKHVEDVYDSLNDKGKLIAQIVFQSLTDLSSEQKGGRRPVELSVIHAITKGIGATATETNQVIDQFRGADTSFIMPPVMTQPGPSLILDISHESLMRNWPMLNGWMRDEVRSGEQYRTLNDRRIRFEQENGPHNRLRGLLLKELVAWKAINYHNSAWASRYHRKDEQKDLEVLFKKNVDFLDECVIQQDKDLKKEKNDLAEKARVDAENISNKRIARVMTRASYIVGTFLVLALIFLVVSLLTLRTLRTKNREISKNIFEIRLRDSTDWWVSSLLSPERRQRVVDTLFRLYEGGQTGAAAHRDSLRGKKLEISLLRLKYAYAKARDVEWGNYLYLLKDARDYDPNFVTTAVFDSILAMTIPPDARHPIEIADVPHYANKSEYLLEPVSEKDGLSAVVVGSQGIYRYYLNEFQKDLKFPFAGSCKPLAISGDATKVLVSSAGRLLLYERDPSGNSWRINNSLDKVLRQIAQYQIVKPKPVLHNQAYFFAEKVDNTRYQTFDLTAAFSGDGSLLAVYDGYSKCRLVQVAGGAIQEFTAGSSAHKLVFNHSGSQLLICQDDSAILVDATSKPAQSSVIFIKNVSGQSRVRIIPQDWAFSPDNRQIYAWTDSVRYAWTVGSKGQYNSRQYTNIGNAERYVPIIGGSLLYTQYKDQHGERGSPLYDPMFIFQYDSSLTRQCFPWHTSTIRAVVPGGEGYVISGDATGIYFWQRKGSHLKEAEIGRFIDPSTLSDRYLEMASYDNFARNGEENVAYYKKATQFGRPNAYVFTKIGNYYAGSTTPDSAFFYYRKAVSISPQTFTFSSNLGKLFYQLHVYDSALIYANQALSMSSGNPKLWSDVARVYYTMDSVDQALQYFRRAVKLAPDDAEILVGLAQAYTHVKKFDSAMACLNNAMETNNRDPKPWAGLALYYNRTGNFSSAVSSADSAVLLNPKYSRGYAELGYAYLKAGRRDSAFKALTNAVRLDSTDYTPYIYLACWYATGTNKEAAFTNLQLAAGKGFRLWDWVDAEPALNRIKDDPRIKGLR